MSIEIAVGGMTCGGCVSSLRKALEREGLAGFTVELGVARVAGEEDVPRARVAIEKAGFTVVDAKTP